ncbi:MAG: nucleoside monophosphate kinase [Verrucomicrobiaceae bacterium]|nr:MAG: nucleoside monophosphate kinase [Verrucomicrobiaceae bacterium]
MKRRIVMLGPPASGKGTQAGLIEARFGIPVTSPGAILRKERKAGTSLGLSAERMTSQGLLLPDHIIVGVISNWLETCDDQFVFDGFPRTIGQADTLEELLHLRGTPLDVVIALEADLPTLQSRVAHRLMCQSCGEIVSVGLHVSSEMDPCPKCGGTLGKRSDDSLETLSARMVEYHEKTEPLVAYYKAKGLLREVDSTKVPAEVFEAITSILESK